MITLVFHINVRNQILSQNQNNSPDYIWHLGTPMSHFCLPLFCNGETVYLESHMMGSTVGLWGSSFFLPGLPSYFFVCCHSNLLLYLLFFVFGLDFLQMGHCGPHSHASSAGLLFWDLFSIRVWGIAACFGGVISSVFSVLTKVGVGTSSILGGIGHDALATNIFVEASIVFVHGVPSLVSGAVDVAMIAALGCCTLRGLSQLGVNGLSSSWNLLVGLGIFLGFCPWPDCILSQVLY